jgi:hypothetical protein
MIHNANKYFIAEIFNVDRRNKCYSDMDIIDISKDLN